MTENVFEYNPRTQQLQPLNIVATNLVKCMNCNKYHEITKVNEHIADCSNTNNSLKSLLNSAIPKSYKNHFQMAKTNNSSRRESVIHDHKNKNPIALNIGFDSTECATLDVHTVPSKELPGMEVVRQKICVPKHFQVVSRQEIELFNEPSVVIDDRKDISSKLENLNLVPSESIRQGQYFEEILIEPQSVQLNNKQIQIFQKGNFAKKQFVVDPHTQYQKVIFNRESIKSPRKMFQLTIATKAKQNKVTIQVKDPKILKAQTQVKITTKKNQEKSKQKPKHSKWNLNLLCSDKDTLSVQKTEELISTHEIQQQYCKNANNTCPGCGGFYCAVCKSTIPPQYRMPPSNPKLESSRVTSCSYGLR